VFPLPGLRTWLSDKLILTTDNKEISKLLIKAAKMIPESQIRVTTDLKCVINFLTSTLRSKTNLLKSLKLSIEAELKIISTFIKKVSRDLTWFLCSDRFLWEILQFAGSEIEVLTDVIPDFHARFSFLEQSKLFLNTCKLPRDNYIKCIKYHTACPAAFLLKNELPKKPIGFVGNFLIWTGSVKRVLKNILNRRNFNSENCQSLNLAFGLLQGVKRGCAPVSETFLQKEVLNHVIAMSTPPTHVPHSYNIDEYTGNPIAFMTHSGDLINDPTSYLSVRVDVDLITDTFSGCCKAILKPVKHPFIQKAYEPSHNSCFEKNRKNGGAYMEIIETMGLPLITSEPIPTKGGYKNNTFYELPKIDSVLDFCRNKIKEKQTMRHIKAEFSDFSDMIEDFDNIFKDEKLSSLINTTVIPLSEPLKVRVITKSEAMPSYASKYLQKKMKSYINRFPSMVLTTRPLDQTDFRRVWAQESEIETRFGIKLMFDSHTSGDYSSATDKLNVNFTKLIFENFMVALGVPEMDKDVYRSVLYEQRLVYPTQYKDFLLNPKNNVSHLDISGNGDFTIEQKNGQLMGSILSFPVLCLANLICYKMALDEYINEIKPQTVLRKLHVNVYSLPVLVNGDDIYFRTNERFNVIWMKYITIAGFELSIGKNYVHSSVFTINSQCFTYNPTSDSLRETTYLNVGLLKGQSKSGVIGETLPIWDLYNKVLKGSNDKLNAHKRFMMYHKNSITQCTGSKKINGIVKGGNYNLFLPKVLGGLGFIRPTPLLEVKITNFQRQLATYFHNKLTQAHNKPTIGLVTGKCALIDENAPKIYDPYLGEPIYQTKLRTEPMPEGYSYPKDIPAPEHLMFHQLANMTPLLKFRSLTGNLLREFRVSPEKSYRGTINWFNLENCLNGEYAFEIVQSIISDQVSLEENNTLLTVKDCLTDIVNNICIDIPVDVTGESTVPQVTI